jgi:hypothetical protein
MKLFCTNCNLKRETQDCWRTVPGLHQLNIWQCSVCFHEIVQPILVGKLIDRSFDDACDQKFQIGRAEHGPVFLNNPLEEIDMELIDAVNYSNEGIRRGYDSEALQVIIAKLKEVDALVRELYFASK